MPLFIITHHILYSRFLGAKIENLFVLPDTHTQSMWFVGFGVVFYKHTTLQIDFKLLFFFFVLFVSFSFRVFYEFYALLVWFHSYV